MSARWSGATGRRAGTGHVACVVALLGTAALSSDALAQRRGSRPPAVTRHATDAYCKAPLGDGARTRRPFCDVFIASSAAESVELPIPEHAGPSTLVFDLHNRFVVGLGTPAASAGYTRHAAVAAVIRPTGEVIEQVAVAGEHLGPADVFDRIVGPGRRGAIFTAPGKPESIQVAVPAGLLSVGIVGVKLEVVTPAGRATHASAGRPIALVSNWRVSY